jgi:hypothetical protein
MSTRDLIDSLQKKNAERALLLDTLRLWDEVKAQGIEPEEVESFSFRDEYLTARERGVHYQYARKIFPATHHNAIKVNGEWRQLKPPLRRPSSCPSPSESSPA